MKLSETGDKDGKIISQKLDQFIAEREREPEGDGEVFDARHSAMAGKSKSEPETSKRGRFDD